VRDHCRTVEVKSRIAIIADDIPDQWGGSEELWSQTAIRLIGEGVSVAASVQGRAPLHDQVRRLMALSSALRRQSSRPDRAQSNSALKNFTI
jgi:hypothetical protein